MVTSIFFYDFRSFETSGFNLHKRRNVWVEFSSFFTENRWILLSFLTNSSQVRRRCRRLRNSILLSFHWKILMAFNCLVASSKGKFNFVRRSPFKAFKRNSSLFWRLKMLFILCVILLDSIQLNHIEWKHKEAFALLLIISSRTAKLCFLAAFSAFTSPTKKDHDQYILFILLRFLYRNKKLSFIILTAMKETFFWAIKARTFCTRTFLLNASLYFLSRKFSLSTNFF